MQRLRPQIEHTLPTGAGPAAGRLDDEGQWQTLVQKAQFPVRVSLIRGVEVDPTFQQAAVQAARTIFPNTFYPEEGETVEVAAS